MILQCIFKNLSRKNKIANIATIVARLLAPFIILFDPIIGIVICTFLDAIDWSIYLTHGINVTEEYYDKVYQEVDKILDLYYYIFLLVYIFGHFDNTLKLIFVLLLIYRLLGVIVFSFVKSRNVFLFFPNIFENFAIGIIIANRLKIDVAYYPHIFLLALFIKIFQEIFVHGPLKEVNYRIAMICVKIMTWPARSFRKGL